MFFSDRSVANPDQESWRGVRKDATAKEGYLVASLIAHEKNGGVGLKKQAKLSHKPRNLFVINRIEMRFFSALSDKVRV